MSMDVHGHITFPALPTSDLHGWRKCNRIVGTILAVWVGLKLLLHFPHFPHPCGSDIAICTPHVHMGRMSQEAKDSCVLNV